MAKKKGHEPKDWDNLTPEDIEILEQEYQEEMKYLASLGTVTYKFQRRANKSHFCEVCGKEIHRSEHVWWYKPYPQRVGGKVKWHKWRTRCVDHEPKKYNEENFDEEVSEGCYEDNNYGRNW